LFQEKYSSTARHLVVAVDSVRKIRGRRIAMILPGSDDLAESFHEDLTAVDGDHATASGPHKTQAYEHAIRMLETVGIPDARAEWIISS
jgi:hypothetical protein